MYKNNIKFCPLCREKGILNELADCDGIYYCDECDKQFSIEEINKEE